MATEAATLSSLESLLNEFFDAGTHNQRKRQIEELLHSFGLQDGAWKQCVYFLQNSTNCYVSMYALGVFETIVNQRWFGFPAGDKQPIRKFLHEYIVQKHSQVPSFISNKTIKVFVNIGRHDWPMWYPNFFSNIVQLLQNPATVNAGVVALQMMSEEFISPREDISMSRRNELKESLLQHIPSALHIVTGLLNNLLHKYKRVATTVTPPPSPSHNSPHHSPRHSPSRTFTGLDTRANQLLQKHDILSPLQCMDSPAEELCCHIFDCLTQYLSWIPLSKIITPELVTKIFNFAEYGCSVAALGGDTASSAVGIRALNCINEILSKKFVPAEYEQFLMQMFQQTFNLLQLMTKGSSSQISGTILSNMDESYLEKFTEFLSLFVANHLRRFEPNDHFPTSELMDLLLKYTIVQQSVATFVSCLDIWVIFLEYLVDKVNTCITLNFKVAAVEKYVSCLQELVTELLKKMQLLHSASWLEDLDTYSLDDDNETEWDKFVNPCLDVISKLADLLPEETISKSLQVFQQNEDLYFALASHIDTQGMILNIPDTVQCKKLHQGLQDLSTSFRLVGRLASLFADEVNFLSRISQAETVFQRVLQGAMFASYYKLYVITTPVPIGDFIEVHAQALGALQAYAHWLLKYQSESEKQAHLSGKYHTLLSSVLEAATQSIGSSVPDKILTAAAHLLVSLTTTIRARFFLTLEPAQRLYQGIGNGMFVGISQVIQTLIVRALSNALVLPWPALGDTSQEWDVRSTSHKSFVASITSDLSTLPDISVLCSNSAEQEKWKPCVKSACLLLTNVVESAACEGSRTRKIVYSSVSDLVLLASQLVAPYLKHPDVTDQILEFLLATIKALKVQMGTVVVEQIIDRLLELMQKEQMLHLITAGSSFGHNTLESFIRILELIVQEPDPSFKRLLPNVLAFGLDSVLPVLDQHSLYELKLVLFDMFHQLLLHNWRYFFKANVISKMSGDDHVNHQEQFVAVLKAFGQPLLEVDIGLFRKSLEVLESLNSKYGLYQKVVFQSTMLSSFLDVLLKVLIHKSHNLLQEEIIQAIHSMVTGSFDVYFCQFVPHFLMNSSGLTDHQKLQLHENYRRHQDLPSFTSSLQQFIGDLRYLQIINSSLPPGTVQL